MNRNNLAASETERRSATLRASVRRPFLILVALVGLSAIGVMVLVSIHRPLDAKVRTTNPGSQIEPISKPSALALTSSDGVLSKPVVPNFERSASSEPTDKSLQLVRALTEVSLQPGELTTEKADQWKQTLEQLIEQGKAAVPALEEFFQSNGDVRLDSIPGGNLLDEPTLRIAFLKVLFDLPTPDNVELQERVLRTTKDPAEITLLARQLELQEPGEYRETIIQAASAVLAQNGQLPDRDAAPIIKLLADYGVKRVK
jgi:hypothetical protein